MFEYNCKNYKTPPTASQRGFTLVELAIVLVIIGLVVGAVLKGQELIASARLKSTMTQVDAVRSATQTFRDKYRALPGDYTNANARIGTPAGVTWASCDGSTACDGDGVVDGTGIATETLLFWNHLSASNLMAGISPTGTATFGDGLPSSPIGGGLTIRNEAVVAKTSHWLTVGSAAATPTGVIDSEQALQIDEKVDDGRPGTGDVRMTTDACTTAADGSVNAADTYSATIISGCVVKFEL